MKKVTLLFGKTLSSAVETDEEFRSYPILGNALALVTYVVEMAATGKTPQRRAFEVFASPESEAVLFPNSSMLTTLSEAYRNAGRIEVNLWTEHALKVAVAVDFAFYPKGKGPWLLTLHGRVDSQYVRMLNLR